MNRPALRRIPLFLIAISFSAVSNAEAVWIDVRSTLEHSVDNIEGDIRINHSDIVQEVEGLYHDKNEDIRLYCRSGGRAEKAKSALEDAGYTNVTNIGGIEDARKERTLKDTSSK